MPILKTSNRSELKENLLADKVESALIWANAHKPLILGVLAGVIFIGLFSSVVIIRSKEAKELNWTLLSRAKELMNQKQYEVSRPAFQEIINNNPNDVVAIHARYHLGEQALREKNFDAAIKQFDSVIAVPNKSPLRPLALTNLAVAYEQKSEFESAAETYQQFMNEYGEHFLAARNQLALGRAWVYAGNNQAAQDSLGQLVDLYPTSKWAENARELMDKIESR